LGDKKIRTGRVLNCHAPDAVSAKYRGKIRGCKEYFALGFVIPSGVEESLIFLGKCLNFSHKIDKRKRDAAG